MSDPHGPPRDTAPRVRSRGSLTPQMHVAVVRQNCASSVTPPSAPLVTCDQTRADFIESNTLVRFSPEAAFI